MVNFERGRGCIVCLSILLVYDYPEQTRGPVVAGGLPLLPRHLPLLPCLRQEGNDKTVTMRKVQYRRIQWDGTNF